jgi:nucleoside-diphosphate-sugar epimerase
MKYLHNNYKSNSVAEIFHPFYRKMIYLDDLVNALLNLVINWSDFDQRSFNLCGDKYYSRLDITEFYNKFVGQLKYQEVKPDINIYKARKEKINITSLNLNKLISRDATTIENAFLIEKNKHE